MNRWRRLLPVVIVALGIAGFALLRATRPLPPPVPVSERVWRVVTAEISPAAQRPVLSLFGQVEAPDRVHARAPIAGRVLELPVRDGERVAAGAVLARLDPRDFEPRREQARAALAQQQQRFTYDRLALAQEQELLRLAEAAVVRAETVQTKQLGSASSVDEARQQLARARLAVTLREQALAEHPARLAALEAALVEAERDAERGTLRAPFAARIATVEAAAGDQVQPHQALLSFYPLDRLYLRARVPVVYQTALRQALASTPPARAYGSQDGQFLTATLERLAGTADPRGPEVLLRFAGAPDLEIGTFLELRLELPAVPDGVALPFAALHGGDHVFAVRDGRLHRIAVTRVGVTVAEDGTAQVLVRAPELVAGTRLLITHLPNAVAGLKVEEIR